MIFQDPYASLNPRRKILDIVAEGIDAHGLAANKKERDAKVIELLETVGLQAEHADRFPHEFSGGQRQRLCIARAILKSPKILILDDSTSAVDTKTDALIRQAFLEKIPHTTRIIISQRVSSIQDADQILVIDDGKISGLGTHEELLKSNAMYKETFEAQNNGGDFDEQ